MIENGAVVRIRTFFYCCKIIHEPVSKANRTFEQNTLNLGKLALQLFSFFPAHKVFDLNAFYDGHDRKAIKAYFDRQYREASKLADGGGYEYEAAKCSLILYINQKGESYRLMLTRPGE